MPNGTIPEARRYEHTYTNAKCLPHRLRFSDGNSYVVKFQGNPVGTIALIREFVALELAQAAHFSIPGGGVVMVDEEFIASAEQLNGLSAGLQFGSLVVSDRPCIFDPFYIDKISNRHQLAQVIVLDTLLCNCDRHEGNLLLVSDGDTKTLNSWRFFMIDHSHCFESLPFASADFPLLLDRMDAYEECLTIPAACQNALQLEVAVAAVEALSAQEITSICARVPSEWGFSDTERDGLSAFLSARIDTLREIMKIS